MAPVPETSLLSSFTNLLRRTPQPSPTITSLSPKALLLAARTKNLLPRGTLANPGAGVIPPTNINNKAIFALFALIGVGIVITGIWFFFWAKNGGFYFRETDWDDYKSTVLRRKGPNGTTLSGATRTTDLGGGSVVHGEKNGRSRWGKNKKNKNKNKRSADLDSRYKDFEDEQSTLNGSIVGTEISSEMSELKPPKHKKKSRFAKERPEDEEMDVGVPDVVRAYRHEKPARVGGINKESDASAFDGSTQDGSAATSDLLSHREHTPTNTPTKVKKERKDNYTGGTGGIRKVVSTSAPSENSFWSRTTGSGKRTNEEEERIKSEAKKLQDKGRAAQRRDFSFQVGDDGSSSGVGGGDEERRARREERRARRAREREQASEVPGSYYEQSELGSAVSAISGESGTGTKSYHHPIPGLSSSSVAGDYAEEKRKKRGYRRGEH